MSIQTAYEPTLTRHIALQDLGPLFVDSLHLVSTAFSPFGERLASYATGSVQPDDAARDAAADRAFADAAAILARPDLRVDVVTGGGMLPMGGFRSYAARSGGDSVVSVIAGGDGWDVLVHESPRAWAAWSVRNVATACMETVPNVLPPVMSAGSFLLACHAIDTFRRGYLQGLLAHKPETSGVVSAAEFGTGLKESVTSGDIRWLLPAVVVLVPGLAGVLPEPRAEDFGYLVDHGVIAAGKDKGMDVIAYGETGHLLGAEFAHTWTLSAGLAFTIMRGGKEQTLHRVFNAGTGLANHLVRFEERDGGLDANHQALTAVETEQKLGELLLACWNVKRDADSAPSPSVTKSISTADKATVAFSPPSTNKTPKFCPSCGAPLKPGAKFCASCGRPL